MPTRFDRAIALIDEASAEDPAGQALDYARRMSRMLARIEPGASEPLRLAARGQHLRRWKIPRSDYPMDRIGYLAWRTALYRFQAEELSSLLRRAGYAEEDVARAARLVRKEHLKSDPEAQALEDAACLVFLESELSDFAAHHEEPRVIEILRKTWRKMSGRGQAQAMRLELPDKARQLLERALA